MIKKIVGIFGVYAVSMTSIMGMEKQERKVEVANEIRSRSTLTIENDARTIRTTVILEQRTPYSRIIPQYRHEARKLTQQNIIKNPEQYREFEQYMHDFIQQALNAPNLVSQRKQYADVVKKTMIDRKKMIENKLKNENLENAEQGK